MRKVHNIPWLYTFCYVVIAVLISLLFVAGSLGWIHPSWYQPVTFGGDAPAHVRAYLDTVDRLGVCVVNSSHPGYTEVFCPTAYEPALKDDCIKIIRQRELVEEFCRRP